MKKKHLFLLLSFLALTLGAQRQPEFSTAGFFQLPNSGREVFSMNPAWRFCKGQQRGAELRDFDDAAWDVVS